MPRYVQEQVEKVSFYAYHSDMVWLRSRPSEYGEIIRLLIRAYRRKCEREADALEEDSQDEQ